MSDGNVSPLRMHSATADAGFANAQLISQDHFAAASRLPPGRDNAPGAAISASPRPHCHYSLLTFLCKGRPKPKNVNNSPIDRFRNDHGCRDRKPDGRCASVVENKPHRQRRYSATTSARLRPSGAASKISNISPRRISGSISLVPGNGRSETREGFRPFIVIAYDGEASTAVAASARAQPGARHSHRVLHGRQACDLQHGAVGPGFCRGGDPRRSRRADFGHTRAARGRCPGVYPAAPAVAGPAESDGAVAASGLGQRLSR